MLSFRVLSFLVLSFLVLSFLVILEIIQRLTKFPLQKASNRKLKGDGILQDGNFAGKNVVLSEGEWLSVLFLVQRNIS